MPNSPTTPLLSESEVERIATRKTNSYGSMVNLPVAERDALIRDWRALKAANETLGQVGIHNAHLIDRIRLWSKCADGYPLDEHINNIATQNAALREQLAGYERLENAINAVSERVLIPEVLAAMERLKERR